MSTRIHLCGKLEIELASRRVEAALRRPASRLLAAHLIAHRSGAVERSELARLLRGGEAALEPRLAELRAAFGDHVVAADSTISLLLPPDAWIDVEVAEQAALSAEVAFSAGDAAAAYSDARTAVDLLAEPYLPEFDGACVRQRRQHLLDVRWATQQRLAAAALLLDPPDVVAAEHAAAELTARQPYRQAGYSLLMEALARQGRRAEALEVFDQVATRFQEELGIEPGPALRRLRARLAEGALVPQPAPRPSADSPVPLPALLGRMERRPLVDREEQIEWLRQQWADTKLGEGTLVLIGGEAGIGKTRLVAHLAAEVRAEGATVLYGRTDEEPARPYQPFAQALRHHVVHTPGFDAAAKPEIARLVPELTGAEAAAPQRPPGERRRHRLFDAVIDVLRSAAADRPLLLVLEDLHWADAPTLLLLREVARVAPECRLLILATWRDDEVEAADSLMRLIADLRREDLVRRLTLEGLDAPHTAALAARADDVAGADSDEARRLQEQTGGNPFFIEELLRSRREVPDAPPPVPEGVKNVIGRRLARLGEDTVDVLITAAFLGQEFTLTTLMAVAADVDAVACVEEAVRAGLLVEEPDAVDRFGFTHALVRETLCEQPILSRRRRIHRALAEALEAAPVDVPPAQLARHYFEAREVGGAEKALYYSLKAAEVALQIHAYEDAAAHYERALTVLDLARPGDRASRADVLLALGNARWHASERGPRLAFEMAASIARELGSATRLARAALGAGGRYYAPGVPDRPYIALLREALAALEPADSALRVRLLARLAENLVFLGRDELAPAVAREAHAMAQRISDPDAMAAALLGLHAALQHIEHAAERRRHAEEALALAGELEDDELAALGRHWLVYDLVELGELPDAVGCSMELKALAHRLRQPLYHHSALAWRGVWAGLAGRFAEAERLAEAAVQLAERAGDPDAEIHFVAQLVALRREQGRLDELREPIVRFADGEGAVALHWRATLPLAHLDAGDVAAARTALDEAFAGGVAAIPRTMLWLSTAMALAEAAAALAHATAAEALYPALEPYAGRLAQTGFTGCMGSVHRALGRLAATVNRPAVADRHFEAALARHHAMAAPALTARTQCDFGELLVTGAGERRAHGTALLASAGSAAERLGMSGVAARAAAR